MSQNQEREFPLKGDDPQRTIGSLPAASRTPGRLDPTTMKQFLSSTLPVILLLLLSLAVARHEVFAQSLVATADPGPEATGGNAAQTPFESEGVRTMRVLVLRLRPGQDLRQQIEAFVKEKQIHAGFIITTVGSLRQAEIRLADQPSATSFVGKFEIVSLVGTLGQDGIHVHISISDSTGKTIGGHLVAGCLIYTTAEIVIGEAEGLDFTREKDTETTYQELRIRKRPKRHGATRQQLRSPHSLPASRQAIQ